jgi:predicted RNase H-like HicB family nuclease
MATSAKSKNSKAIDRPFAPEVLSRARKLAERYKIVIEQEDGEYYGHALEVPGARDDGATPNECVARTRQAVITMVAYMIEQGEVPPVPASEGQRTEQVNVRLSVEEKMAIEAAARRKGFKGMSDYMRAAALV